MQRQGGFTMLELTVAMGILVVISGVLFTLAVQVGDAAQLQETKVATGDEARTAMMFLIRDLRQATLNSITMGNVLPSDQLQYRVARDVDGNGTAVNAAGDLETSPIRIISRDTGDLNNDGITTTQLIVQEGAAVTVITNGLLEDEDSNANGVLDAGEDANSNGRLDRGLLFEQDGSGVRVTVQAERRPRGTGPLLSTSMVEVVVPRNQ